MALSISLLFLACSGDEPPRGENGPEPVLLSELHGSAWVLGDMATQEVWASSDLLETHPERCLGEDLQCIMYQTRYRSSSTRALARWVWTLLDANNPL